MKTKRLLTVALLTAFTWGCEQKSAEMIPTRALAPTPPISTNAIARPENTPTNEKGREIEIDELMKSMPATTTTTTSAPAATNEENPGSGISGTLGGAPKTDTKGQETPRP